MSIQDLQGLIAYLEAIGAWQAAENYRRILQSTKQ